MRRSAFRFCIGLLVAYAICHCTTTCPAADGPKSAAAAKPSAPPWLGNKTGLSNEVLAPWTPVEVAGNRVRVWGRTYTLGAALETPPVGLPLPTSIVACDAELLARPITLAGAADGKPLAWTVTGEEGRTRRAGHIKPMPNEAVLVAQAESGSLYCMWILTVQFDGMVRCYVMFVPKPGVPAVSLDRLDLEIPLRKEHAVYLHTWPGAWGTAANSRALPAEGQGGTDSKSVLLGGTDWKSVLHSGPFKPFVWLGDAQRGLAWFMESEENFSNRKGDPVIEIRREGDAVVLRVHLVTIPRKITESLEYEFGLQATPVKPERPDAWDYRTVHMGSYSLVDQEHTTADGRKIKMLDHLAQSGVRTICFHEHWSDIQNYPKAARPEALHRLVRECHERGIQLLLYFGYEMANIAPEWDQYHDECLVFPRAGGYKRKPTQIDYVVCYRSHWQDFLARGIDRIMEEFKIDGVYLDGTSEPWACANVRHGCGFKRPDGSIGPTYSIFATRQMMKRIYTIVKHHNPAGQVNVHQSTCMTIPTLAFATSYWDGEQLQSVKRKNAAMELLPLGAFCTEFMGHNWGVPAELLWYGNGPFRRVEAVTLGLLHDIPTRPSSMADLEISSRLWKVRDAFGCLEAEWIPYWESGKVARTSDAAMKISLHNRPGRGVLAVMANLGAKPARADVTFDLAALKQPGPLAAHDVLADKDLPLADGKLDVALGPLEHVVVWLKAK